MTNCNWAAGSQEPGGAAGGQAAAPGGSKAMVKAELADRGHGGGDARTGAGGKARHGQCGGAGSWSPSAARAQARGPRAGRPTHPGMLGVRKGSSTWRGRSSLVAGTGLAELVRDLVDGGQRDGVTSLQQRPRGHHAAPTVCWAGTGARPGLCPSAAQTTHLPPQAMALSPAPAWLGTCAHLPTGPAWPCHQGLPSCQPSAMKVSCCPRRGPRSPSQCHS